MNNHSLTILSGTFLVIAIYICYRKIPSKMNIILCGIVMLTSIILFAAYGIANYFTGNGIDEATIYHLKYGLSGAGFREYYGLFTTTIIALLFVLLLLKKLSFKAIRNDTSPTHYSIVNSVSLYSLLPISLILNPASINIYKLQASSSSQTHFYDYYRKPQLSISSNNPKNIIYIYAESLERTYFDQTIFPGLIKGLRDLESKSTYFTNIKQLPGTGWTIAGMTASQCGIPLFTPSHGNSMSGMDQFLSSAVCLGDLLRDDGYHLAYYGGSRLDFAGKGKFYKTHGFSDINGYDELKPKIKDLTYITGWGLYDDSLFSIVYNEFVKLSEEGKRFGLFTLTLDTHHPNGHPSRSCVNIKYKDGTNPILNSVACSDYLISNFIKKIKNSPYADQTLIVLVSDHLAMRNSASELLQKKDRKNLFMIIEPGTTKATNIRTLGSTMDIGATILPFIGYTGEIGLGRNLLNDVKWVDIDNTHIHANLMRWKKPIQQFWNFPRIQHKLAVNADTNTVQIDNRTFRTPILIELNNQLETTLKFQTHNSPGQKSLIQHLYALEQSKYFLLISGCNNINISGKPFDNKGQCLLSGDGNGSFEINKINKNIIYSANEIRHLLNIPNSLISNILTP